MSCKSMKLQLKISPQLQVLAGFIIESIDGMAIHSQGEDKEHLQLLMDVSSLEELDIFMENWNNYCIKYLAAQSDL